MFIGLANYFRDHNGNVKTVKRCKSIIEADLDGGENSCIQGMSDSCLELPTAILSR